jgi:hypothetical protein
MACDSESQPQTSSGAEYLARRKFIREVVQPWGEPKPKPKKKTRPLVNWWACSRVTNGGYWRKKINGKQYYFRFPNTPEGYALAVVEYEKLTIT